MPSSNPKHRSQHSLRKTLHWNLYIIKVKVLFLVSGDKKSLLNKLFGRGKSNKRSSSTEEGPSSNKSEEKEYATFSAQFPPPDWQLYEQQVQSALHNGHMSRNATWQRMKSPVFLPETDANDSYECPVHTAKPLPPHFNGFLEDSMKCTLPRQRSTSSTSSQSSSYQEIPGSPSKKQEYMDNIVKPRSRANKKHTRRQASDRHSRLTPHEELDVRPKVLSSKPDDVTENTYLDLTETAGPVKQEAEAVPTENPFGAKHRHRTNQKSRIFKKYREMYCASFPNDTTSEYIGKLPSKETGYSMSRDSGVNCVGLNQGEGVKVVTKVSETVEETQKISPPNPPPLNNQTQQPPPKQHQHQQQQVLELNNLRFVQTTFHNDNANSVTVHKAQIHCIPETSQEDSGFNSPRLDNLDSLNNTPHTTPQELQNNLKKKDPELKVVSSSKVSVAKINNEGFSKSIDNLHGEGAELGNGGMWSSSSQQTVREAKPLPHLPPPREWTLPRPVHRDQNEKKSPDSDLPKVGLLTEQEQNKKQEQGKNNVREELNGKSGFRLSVSLKESFFNGDVKPKTQDKNSEPVNRQQNAYSSMDGIKYGSLRRNDKVKRNLGEEMESAKEGTRLHERVYQEYHNNNHHHSKTSLNGNARKGDFEVVGIV